MNCANNLDHEEERSRAIKSCLERNPHAFHPKIGTVFCFILAFILTDSTATIIRITLLFQ